VGLSAQNQPSSITGIVTDANNLPVPGVSVLVKGTSNGTSTDTDGSYTLHDVPENGILVFSLIGYNEQEIPVTNQKQTINVTLIEETTGLDEVVVIGYGTQAKKDVTGSVASADIESFRNQPNTNIAQSLQGTVPGLNIGQVNSSGQTPSISIRGESTISGNSKVLIILDGIPYDGALSALNPDDIASIDVLKDASSTAVYGAQAANGVILITSRTGRSGRPPQISLSSSYTIQEPTNTFRPMGRDEYLEHIRELFWDEAFLAPDYTQPNPEFDLISKVDPIMKDQEGALLNNNFDWWDAATQKGQIREIQANLSGGTERTTYLLSAGLTDQHGFIKNDFFQRRSLRVNLESKATDWWKVGIQSFGSFVKADGSEPNLAEIIRQSPLLVPYDENGDLIPNPFNTLDKNPFLSYDVDDYDRENYIFANLYSEIDFPFLPGLKYRINFGNNYKVANHYYASEYDAGLTGRAYKNHGSSYDYTLDNILSYDKTFGMHDIGVTLLYGASERKYDYTSSSANGFARLTLGYHNLQQGDIQYSNSNAWHEALLYQMARVNYKFKDRYLLTGTIRRDGFSGFAENNKYGVFPSVAIGWILSNESFLNLPSVDQLKLRVGYGVSGNQTSRYKSISRLISRASYVFGDGGSTAFGQEVSSMANPDLRWERTVGLNLGVDFSIFAQRLTGRVDYYNNITNDLLFDVSIPYITGFNTISTNLGRLKNVGFELSISSKNIINDNFEWNSTVNFTTNKNEVLELLGNDIDGDGKEDDLITSNLFIGESLGTIYHYVTNGMYQVGDEVPSGYYPGNFRIVDTNNDGQISPDDRMILGRTTPAFRLSLWNQFTYKQLSLGVFINSIQGGKNGYLGNNVRPLVRNDNNIRYSYFSGMDYWAPWNPDAENPRSKTSPAISPNIYRSRSFVRLQDVSLSYKFDGIPSTPIKEISIFLSGKNLATWTNWKGWDPETNQGLTIEGRPVLRSYSLGLNITL